METFPLKSITLEEAKEMQFRLVDCITREFDGEEILSFGDLGIHKKYSKPAAAHKAERVLADFFGAQSCALVRGSGTGALRLGLQSIFQPGGKILVHDAPVYNTTQTSMTYMGLKAETFDFNNLKGLEAALDTLRPDGVLLQYARQKLDDSYDLGEVIGRIKAYNPALPILTDDNYAVMKVALIGCELGADISAFSAFKLLGPEGVGVIVGKKEYVEKADQFNYSGGSKVQGHEAMALLRGLVYAPVALAIQAEENEKLVQRLNQGEVQGVKRAFLANAQSKVLLVELAEGNALAVLERAVKLGAAPHPVGAESKYEIAPMFYRVSGTFLKSDPTLGERMIRINPNRSGADTVIRILNNSINPE